MYQKRLSVLRRSVVVACLLFLAQGCSKVTVEDVPTAEETGRIAPVADAEATDVMLASYQDAISSSEPSVIEPSFERSLDVFGPLTSVRTAIRAYQVKLAIHSDNLANVDSVGYKRRNVVLSPGTPTETNSDGISTGIGVNIEHVVVDIRQGSFRPTGRSLDVAIDGLGFFKFFLDNGEFRYTRRGVFSPDQTGTLALLVNGRRHTLVSCIAIPSGSVELAIGEDGTCSCVVNGARQSIGTLALYSFCRPEQLEDVGEGIFKATDESGCEISGNALSEGFGTLRPGFLECSNVDLVEEFALLRDTQRKLAMFTSVLDQCQSKPPLVWGGVR